jgi:hypothetical protein
MNIDEFIRIINIKNNDYPLAKDFVKRGLGQLTSLEREENYSGNYSGDYGPSLKELENLCKTRGKHGNGKSGSNEKEHVLASFLYKYDSKSDTIEPSRMGETVKEIYENGPAGKPITCKEYYICLAEIAGVDGKLITKGIERAEEGRNENHTHNRRDSWNQGWHKRFKQEVGWEQIKEALTASQK